MNVRGFGPGGACATDAQSVAIAQIIGLLQRISCKESCNLQMISECLTVTIEGDWGEVGDVIQALRWFDPCQIPPTSFIVVYVNTNTNTIVTGVDGTNTEPCTVEVSPTTWTAGTSVVTRDTTSAAGSTTANIFGVTITNIGTVDGTVGGETLAPNQTLNLGAFSYEVNNTVYRVPSIAYNATGTIFSITEVSS